jgi:hypothetical protein
VGTAAANVNDREEVGTLIREDDELVNADAMPDIRG